MPVSANEREGAASVITAQIARIARAVMSERLAPAKRDHPNQSGWGHSCIGLFDKIDNCNQ